MNNEDKIISMLEVLTVAFGSFQEEFLVIKQDISTLKQDVATLKQDVALLKHEQEIMKMDIIGIKEEVSNLKEEVIEEIKEKAEITRYVANKFLGWQERVERILKVPVE